MEETGWEPQYTEVCYDFEQFRLYSRDCNCHGPCLVMFFPKNNQRMALTESPMMATLLGQLRKDLVDI